MVTGRLGRHHGALGLPFKAEPLYSLLAPASAFSVEEISGSEHYTMLLQPPATQDFLLYTLTGKMASQKM